MNMKNLVISLLLIACAAIAQAQNLAVKLEAFKVLAATATREEQFIAADEAAPGDIIEYRAVYTNGSESLLRNLVPEIPIPEGLIVVAGSDVPKAASASLDRVVFSPLPLLDKDGKPVSTTALRAFRWNIADLAAGESVTVRIRAGVAR